MKFLTLLDKLPYSEHGPIGQIYFLLTFIFRIALLIAIGESIYVQNWITAVLALVTFILTFLPYFIEKNYSIKLPLEFEFVIFLFLYAALFLGELHDYYALFWWWDIMLHAGSALIIGLVGFMLLYILYRGKKIQARPGMIVLFAFCFALAFGAVWEIFEFGMDQSFGFNMQKSGLVDTMWDLIIDAIGALVASLFGYVYLKRGEDFIITRIIKRLKKDNPALFEDD